MATTFDGKEVNEGDEVWVLGSTGYHKTTVAEPVTNYELFGPIPVSNSFSSEESIKEYINSKE